MKTTEITVNGYTFSVEQNINDDNCYGLMYGNVLVLILVDTACEDPYGDIEDVAEMMAAMVQEEAEKPFPWFTIRGAVIEQGSDPTRIESDEEAKEWGEAINSGSPYELTDEEEIREAKEKLGFDETHEVKHIYAFCDGNTGCFALDKDY